MGDIAPGVTAGQPAVPPAAPSGVSEPRVPSPGATHSGDAAHGGPEVLAAMAASAGIRSIDVVAWRDLDDAEAGGSELHAHEVLRRWAAAGIEVRLWTSRVDGAARSIVRDRYAVHRRAGRYAVFPRTAVAALRGRLGTADALVEIWNGMPFFSPLWSRKPRIVFLHHVHADMWQMVLSPSLSRLGYAIEHRLAPPIYRRTPVVTLSASSRQDIVERLRLRPDRVIVAPPGIDARFRPEGPKAPHPLVVTVGRLVPVKQFDRFIDAMVDLRRRCPTLEAVIIGEGYERPALEERIADAGAGDWLTMPGRLSDAALLDAYRRAWLVVATSSREGWGMTLTEGAACGTPAVAWRIAGHEDAVAEGESGLLVDSVDQMVDACASVLTDPMLRRRLGQGALRHAERFTWDTTAAVALAALTEQFPGSA